MQSPCKSSLRFLGTNTLHFEETTKNRNAVSTGILITQQPASIVGLYLYVRLFVRLIFVDC